MSFDRFAAAMIVIGAGVGFAAASAVPTSQASHDKSYRSASAADYPEISAVTYESYPIAQAPLMRRAPLKLAAWDAPWSEGSSDIAVPLPEQIDPDFQPDPQVVEDDHDAEPPAADRGTLQRASFEPEREPVVDAQPAKAVRITLSDLP